MRHGIRFILIGYRLPQIIYANNVPIIMIADFLHGSRGFAAKFPILFLRGRGTWGFEKLHLRDLLPV
jgi:hypothetical protein